MAKQSKNQSGNNVEAISPELGHLGIYYDENFIYEEAQRDLMYPNSVVTFDKMSQNIVIATALNVANVIASRTPFYFESYDDKQVNIKRRDFVKDCFNDMTHNMKDFILDCMTAHKYGFAVIEKVFRYRNRSEGSKFDDGLVGIKRLPLRHQSTLCGWDFDDSLRELQGVYQGGYANYVSSISNVDGFKVTKLSQDIDVKILADIYISRDRFLHIKADGTGGNPEGKSPLASCYTSWKKLNLLLDTEEIACYKNLNGIPVLKIHQFICQKMLLQSKKELHKYIKMELQN